MLVLLFLGKSGIVDGPVEMVEDSVFSVFRLEGEIVVLDVIRNTLHPLFLELQPHLQHLQRSGDLIQLVDHHVERSFYFRPQVVIVLHFGSLEES